MPESDKLRRVVLDVEGIRDDVDIERIAGSFFLLLPFWDKEDRSTAESLPRYRNERGVVVTVRDGGLIDPDPRTHGTGEFFPRKS